MLERKEGSRLREPFGEERLPVLAESAVVDYELELQHPTLQGSETLLSLYQSTGSARTGTGRLASSMELAERVRRGRLQQRGLGAAAGAVRRRR